jgi:thioredoxin-related protein
MMNAEGASDEDKLFASQFGVESFPSIFFFDHGEQKYQYMGHHNVDSYIR